MKSKHITKILDKAAFTELSETDKETVSLHISDCAGCRRAFGAARLSSFMLKADSGSMNVPAPSPFFQSKVMNAWCESQLQRPRPIEAFRRWWQASAAPVFLMLATMAILISLTVFAPQSSAGDAPVEISSFNLYSTENIVLNQKPSKDLTNEQVFQVIYSAKSGLKK